MKMSKSNEAKYCDDNVFVVVNEFDHLTSMFKVLELVTADNLDYFVMVANDDSNSYTKFGKTFQSILNLLGPLKTNLDVITGACGRFDLNALCKGNGYRSIVHIVESCLKQVTSLSEQIQRNRDKLFFRSYQMYAELDSYAQVIARLHTIVHFAIVLIENSENCLFPKDTPKVCAIIDNMMDDFDNMSRECFYGRSFGFQYSLTVRQSMQVVGVAMAAYGDGYIRHTDTLSRAVSSVIHSGKYLIDPELRAKRITELTQGIDIKFCKSFWSLPEEYGVQHAPLLVCPAMDVNLEFLIPPDDLQIRTLNGQNITVKLPLCNEEQKGVKSRLLSFVWRNGQLHNVWKTDKSYGPLGPKPRQQSRYLMIHCHGGGFVAQSSKSHEIYLRHWAKELRIPILSIDYSLAPEAAFPQGLNEVFFAYVWALNNFKKLGTTGEKIVFTGDSAGANLVTALTLKCIISNIRLPDSLVVAYPPYRVQYYPSPSRILCLMDPLLPLGVLKSCIQAYSGELKSGNTNISNNIDLLQLTSNLYNPYAVDLGEEHWSVRHSHRCGQFHSLSETNLDMIKNQLGQIQLCAEEDEYFSDCATSDFDLLGVPDSDEESLKRSSSFGNVFKRTPSEDVIASKKACRKTSADNVKKVEESPNSLVTASSSSSLFHSLKSQVSSQVFDLTSRVSSKVFDDIKSSVTQQIPSTVLDASTKMIDDIKSGFSSYLSYDRRSSSKSSSSSTNDDSSSKGTNNSFTDGQIEQLDNMTVSSGATRKRCLTKSSSGSSNEVEQKFSICKDCLCPAVNCNCNLKWTGLTVKKKLFDRNGSRHSLSSIRRTRKLSVCQDVLTSTLRKEDRIIKTPEPVKRTIGKSPVSLTTIKPTIGFQMVDKSHLPHDMHNELSLRNIETTDSYPEIMSTDFRNPLMSPMYASDTLLKKMPPVIIFACSLDPLFDDSIEFIRRLKGLDKSAELHVLERLPHGFLNFHVFSPEAHEACNNMIAAIKRSLDMNMNRNASVSTYIST